jgi:polar amino acid transport system permease protein
MISRLNVEFVRNMPPVVFLFIFYFFISSQLIPILGIDEISVRASPTTMVFLEIVFGPPQSDPDRLTGCQRERSP